MNTWTEDREWSWAAFCKTNGTGITKFVYGTMMFIMFLWTVGLVAPDYKMEPVEPAPYNANAAAFQEEEVTVTVEKTNASATKDWDSLTEVQKDSACKTWEIDPSASRTMLDDSKAWPERERILTEYC